MPDLKDNLISQGQIEKKGYRIEAFEGKSRVLHGNKLLFQAHRVSRMYYITTVGGVTTSEIKAEYNSRVNKASKAKRVSFGTWHSRLGHPNDYTLGKLKVISNLIEEESKEEEICLPCIQGKFRRASFPVGVGEKARNVLDRIHSDVMGYIRPESRGGRRFIITFDEASRYITAVAIRKKSDAFEEFRKYKERVEMVHGRRIREFQTDQGGGYLSSQFTRYLEECRILHRESVPHTLQQNGLAERANQTICNAMRCMLIESGLQMSFWAEAVQTA